MQGISEVSVKCRCRLMAEMPHILAILQILDILLQTTKGRRAIDIKVLTDLRLLFCPLVL